MPERPSIGLSFPRAFFTIDRIRSGQRPSVSQRPRSLRKDRSIWRSSRSPRVLRPINGAAKLLPGVFKCCSRNAINHPRWISIKRAIDYLTILPVVALARYTGCDRKKIAPSPIRTSRKPFLKRRMWFIHGGFDCPT